MSMKPTGKSRVAYLPNMMTRRTFTKLAGLAGAGTTLGLSARRAGAADCTPLETRVTAINLGGSNWSVRQEGATDTIPASVPGDNFSDLLRAGKIPDPYYRDNNKSVQWVADKSWTYERTFDLPPAALGKDCVQLVCHGLDTFCTISLNGAEIGRADNMFRVWTFDIKPRLKPSGNILKFEFEPPAKGVAGRSEAYFDQFGIKTGHPYGYVRKAPYQWGWDWCRPLVTSGIWKPIEILAYDSRIADLDIRQAHLPSGAVRIEIEAAIEGAAGGSVRARLVDEPSPAVDAALIVSRGNLRITLDKPRLWWPNGLGAQDLYTVEVTLLDASGALLDTVRRRFGIRQFEMVPAAAGQSMQLRVNGVPFFAKGANWVPPDNLTARLTPAVYDAFMRDAAACNFNFIRLWGGGLYEDDAMFDACDELGVVLQFEFKFANAIYPAHDPDFVDNVRAEIRDNVRRVRHHPCIAIWSGNNEIGGFDGYDLLFDQVIGGEVREMVPGAFYEVGSGAHGSGDAHSWGVWGRRKPAEDYDNVHGFVAEFGMQSFNVPASVVAYAGADDMKDPGSMVFAYHELSGGAGAVTKIIEYIRSIFGVVPNNLADVAWLSQIMQSYIIRHGVEHWRRERPRSMAAVVWQLNDSWPGETWSMIDYFHRWKALQYHSRHMFAPRLGLGPRGPATGRGGYPCRQRPARRRSRFACVATTRHERRRAPRESGGYRPPGQRGQAGSNRRSQRPREAGRPGKSSPLDAAFQCRGAAFFEHRVLCVSGPSRSAAGENCNPGERLGPRLRRHDAK